LGKTNSQAPNWGDIKRKSYQNLIFFPLGGVGKFGMNLMILIFEGQYFVFDCGALFPDDYILGVDKVIPKLPEEFAASFGNPTAYLISHGHEDHIGSLPAYLESHPAPVYSTGCTKTSN
jgi:ribonuclease J